MPNVHVPASASGLPGHFLSIDDPLVDAQRLVSVCLLLLNERSAPEIGMMTTILICLDERLGRIEDLYREFAEGLRHAQ